MSAAPTAAEPPKLDAEQVARSLNRVPFFMTQYDATNDSGEENVELEALRALSYMGPPEEIARNCKTQGNDCFNAHKYKDAVIFYSKALEIEHPDTLISIACYNNRAACNLELHNYRRCISDANKALELDPNNLKAVFRASKALLALNHTDEALALVQYGLSQDPQNPALQSQLKQANSRLQVKQELELRRREKEAHARTVEQNLALSLNYHNIHRITLESQDTTRALTAVDPQSAQSDLLITIEALYPLDVQSDMIENVDFRSPLQDQLVQLFDVPAPWMHHSSNKYSFDSIAIYLRTIAGGLVRVGTKTTPLRILSAQTPRVPLINNALRLYLVPQSMASKWVSSWSKTPIDGS